MFLRHLEKKYGVKTITEIKKNWTQEEHEFFTRALKRKAGEEPVGPYPD